MSNIPTMICPLGSFDYKRRIDHTSDARRTLSSILQKDYSLVTLPQIDAPVVVEPGLTLTVESITEKRDKNIDDKQRKYTEEERSSRAVKSIVELLATMPSERGPDKALLFLEVALKEYKTRCKEETIDRYLFVPLLPKVKSSNTLTNMHINKLRRKYGSGLVEEGGDNNNDFPQSCTAQRYLLTNEKTFDSMFFPEKAKLLALIDQFVMGTGKYAVPGFARKLVFLLHGPPGTGKTSLVKAIAAYTRRHIFSIDLSRMRTNRQLINFMFTQKIKLYVGENCTSQRGANDVTLQPNKVVYVLEDIDAAVSRMAHPSRPRANVTRMREEQFGVDQNVDDVAEDVMLSERRDKIHEQDQGRTIPTCMTSLAESSTIKSSGDDAGKDKSRAAASPMARLQWGEHAAVAQQRKRLAIGEHKRSDTLTVQGVLHALSGMYDCPGRIVILTTNHIEHLDPILLQPGVLTMTLHMDVFTPDCAMEMIRHYFSPELEGVADKDNHILTEMYGILTSLSARENQCFSPAEVEHLCAEHDTLQDLLIRLKRGRRHEVF